MEKATDIDNMVISLLNQDKEAFSVAFSDAMQQKVAEKIVDLNLEVSKDLVDEGWPDKALAMATRVGKRVAAKGAQLAKDNPETMKAIKGAGKFARGVAADPNVRQSASDHAATAKSGADEKQMQTSRQGVLGTIAKSAASAGYDAWKKKREFQKAKETGASPPLKLASSYESDGDELTEINRGSANYTFASPSVAKKFVSSATKTGVNKRNFNVKGNSVSIVNLNDRDMKEMLHYLAKEMKAQVKEDSDPIVSALQYSISSDNDSLLETKNQTNINITPEDAKIIVQVHDNLNDENQKILRDSMQESEEEYTKILKFCTEQYTEEQIPDVN